MIDEWNTGLFEAISMEFKFEVLMFLQILILNLKDQCKWSLMNLSWFLHCLLTIIENSFDELIKLITKIINNFWKFVMIFEIVYQCVLWNLKKKCENLKLMVWFNF